MVPDSERPKPSAALQRSLSLPSPYSRDPAASNSRNLQHAPAAPSQLRSSFIPSPLMEEAIPGRFDSTSVSPFFSADTASGRESGRSRKSDIHAATAFTTRALADRGASPEPDARTRLLSNDWDRASGCGAETCNHGTFSPRPDTHRSYGSTFSADLRDRFGGRFGGSLDEVLSDSGDRSKSFFGEDLTRRIFGGSGSKADASPALQPSKGSRKRRERLRYVMIYFSLSDVGVWIALVGLFDGMRLIT